MKQCPGLEVVEPKSRWPQGDLVRDDSKERGGLLFAVLVVAGFGFLAVSTLDTLNLAVDDVFISFRYAENLVRGLGLVFNAGERVEGYSNPMWTLMLAGFARLGFTQRAGDFALLVPAKLAGAAFGLATFAVLCLYVARLRRRVEWGGYGPLLGLAPLALGASYSFGLWGVSGMETPQCAFFVTAALFVMLETLRRFDDQREVTVGGAIAAGVLFGLACLTRPEPIFVGGFAVTAFVLLGPRELRRLVVIAAIPVIVIYGASLAWRLGYYGALLPNSVVAKTGGGLHSGILGLKYAFGALFATVGYLGLGLFTMPSLVRERSEWTFLACFAGGYVLFAVASGGDWMPGYRLLVPALPALVLVAVLASLRLAQRVTPAVPRAGLALLVVAFATLAFASERNLVRSQRAFPTGFKQQVWQSSPLRIEVARALAREAPAGSVVALAECGYIPYFNPDLRFLDVLGLMDPKYARMATMDPEDFVRRAPDYYLLMIRWGQPSRESLPLLASESFRSHYERIAYFDGLQGCLRALEEGRAPQLQEDQSFVLFRRSR
jgi:arabinofuranosyltransferase